MKFIGAGTQKVVAELQEIFPGLEILRMDTDSLSSVNTHEALFSRFERDKIPVLIGTQMVAKGLNFENVTLVGVISVDQSLYSSDYRAHERTFSLITQVVGRSGRGNKEGRAVLQTFTPENEVIKLAAKQDYEGFYNREIEMRQALGCPPISDMFVLTVSGVDETSVIRASSRLKNTIETYLKDDEAYRVLGPAPASITRINNKYRYFVTIIGNSSKKIREIIAHVMKLFSAEKENRGLSVFADFNPLE